MSDSFSSKYSCISLWSWFCFTVRLFLLLNLSSILNLLKTFCFLEITSLTLLIDMNYFSCVTLTIFLSRIWSYSHILSSWLYFLYLLLFDLHKQEISVYCAAHSSILLLVRYNRTSSLSFVFYLEDFRILLLMNIWKLNFAKEALLSFLNKVAVQAILAEPLQLALGFQH